MDARRIAAERTTKHAKLLNITKITENVRESSVFSLAISLNKLRLTLAALRSVNFYTAFLFRGIWDWWFEHKQKYCCLKHIQKTNPVSHIVVQQKWFQSLDSGLSLFYVSAKKKYKKYVYRLFECGSLSEASDREATTFSISSIVGCKSRPKSMNVHWMPSCSYSSCSRMNM